MLRTAVINEGTIAAGDPAWERTLKGLVAGQKLFQRYTLEKILGRGGMGVVWLARDERLQRAVALKVLPDEVFHDPAARDDLKHETRKSLELTHPNIVRIHDFVEDETAAAISMEYVEGATFSQLRLERENKCFDPAAMGPWVLQICEALDYAHRTAKLVHRDLKPANVMVNPRGQVRITDFGIACSLRDSLSRVSFRQNSSGTMAYMGPQQMMGEAPSPLDDLYALGSMLYEMLTSKPPFYAGDIALQVREVTPVPMSERRQALGITGETIPRAWENAIAKCLSKDPARRPRDTMELARLLGLGDKRGTAAAEQPRMPPPARAARFLLPAWLPARYVCAGLLCILFFILGMFAVRALIPQRTSETGRRIAAALPAPRPAERAAQAAPALAPATAGAVLTSVTPADAALPVPAPSAAAEAPGIWGDLAIQTTPTNLHYRLFEGSFAGLDATRLQAMKPMREGTTPAQLSDLKQGVYTAVCSRAGGWDDQVREITIVPEKSTEVQADFPSGALSVTSIPAGANVLMDGDSIGVAPLTVDVPPGDHEITGELPKNADAVETVTVTPGQPAQLNLRLQKQRSHTHRKPKKTPPQTEWQKVQGTLHKFFGGTAQKK